MSSTANKIESSSSPLNAFDLWLGDDGSRPRAAIKDVINIRGYPTRASCNALEDAKNAEHDAPVVESLKAAGYSIVGKTALHELAFGVTGLNANRVNPVNPRFPNLITGGSSSGSAAAVAGGLCEMSLGTDTGGSIRVPAACCGIYGFKPTYGYLSRTGLTPAKSSLDCVGPFAANIKDLCDAFAAMDPSFGYSRVGRLKLGAVSVDASAEVLNACATWLSSAGTDSENILLPGMAAAEAAALKLITRETYDANHGLLEKGGISDDVAARMLRGRDITDADIAQAEAIREAFTSEVDSALEGLDALVMPTLPFFPPTLDEVGDLMSMVGITSLCRPFNLSGHPVISIPLPVVNGRPNSLQIIGRKDEDVRLLNIVMSLLENQPDMGGGA